MCKVRQGDLDMKLFKCVREGAFAFIAFGYGRGHAVKQIAKELEKRGLELQKTDEVTEIPMDEKTNRKGMVIDLTP